MKNLLNTRYNRTLAFGMFLVWTLGLIFGVADACLLQDPSTATQENTSTQFGQHRGKQANLTGHSHIKASQAQTDSAHKTKQPCLKVRDESSRSLLQRYSIGQVDPGLPIMVAVLWSLVEPAYFPDQPSDNAQRVTSHVPLRYRFSKLTL